MNSWIFPLTILPGIGLLILSTTNWAVALTNEIDHLLPEKHCNPRILKLKIAQLGLLHRALVALYICVSMNVLAGFTGAVWPSGTQGMLPVVTIFVSIGMAFLFAGTFMLIVYAYRAVNIKRNQFLERL